MKYSLEKLYEFRKDPKIKEEVFNQYQKISNFFKQINIDIFQEIEDCLDEISFSQLKNFIGKEKELKNLLFDWEDIDIRVSRSLEYSLIKEKMEELQSFYKKIEVEREEKISEIKKLFSKYLEELRRKVLDLKYKKIEAREVGYSDFKPYVEKHFGEKCSIRDFLNSGTPQEIFEAIKTDSLLSALNKEAIIEENNGYLDIFELEDKDLVLYELLRAEALKTFCEENFSHTPKAGATQTQIEITPGADLGKEMELETSQLVLINLSLDRFALDTSDIKKRFDGKTFNLVDGRKYNLEQSSKVKVQDIVVKKNRLNGDILYIKVPLYMRHTVFNLISSQRMRKK